MRGLRDSRAPVTRALNLYRLAGEGHLGVAALDRLTQAEVDAVSVVDAGYGYRLASEAASRQNQPPGADSMAT